MVNNIWAVMKLAAILAWISLKNAYYRLTGQPGKITNDA